MSESKSVAVGAEHAHLASLTLHDNASNLASAAFWSLRFALGLAALALCAVPALAAFSIVGNHAYVQSNDGIDFVQPVPSIGEPSGIFKVAYGNGSWVAVGGDYGFMWRTTDAQHWSKLSPPLPAICVSAIYMCGPSAVGFTSGPGPGVPFFIWDIVFDDGQFVAVGPYDFKTSTQIVYTSPDGVNWAMRNTPQHWLLTQQGVAFGQGKFLSVGVAGSMMWSDDGATWLVHHTGQPKSLWGVAHDGAGLWVAVGTNGTIITSQDGLIWATVASGVTDELYAVTFGNGKWIVTGAGGTILESPNGMTWTAQTMGAWMNLRDVFYANGLYVTIAEEPANFTSHGSALWISRDGTAWQSRPLNAENWFGAYGVTYGGGYWVAVGGTTLSRSSDGLDWISANPATSNHQWGVASNGTVWVSVGWWGSIFTGPDGQNWTARYSGRPAHLYGVTWGAGQWVAVGRGGTILTSEDSIHWTQQVAGTWQHLFGVTHGPDGFVAVGRSGTVLHSRDGRVWSPQPIATSRDLMGVAYGDRTYVLVGVSGQIFTSTDGMAWTQRGGVTSQNLYAVAFDSTRPSNTPRWAIVGESATVVYSTDAFSWFSGNVPASVGRLTSVAASNGRWVTVSRAIVGSSDTVNWNILPVVLDTYFQNPTLDTVGSDDVPPLECGPEIQDAALGQEVQFGVHGGHAPYKWSRPGATGGTPSGPLASASYTEVGQYQVMVHDSAEPPTTAFCTVEVDGPPRCETDSTRIFTGQSGTFRVRAGRSPFAWTDPISGETRTGNEVTVRFPSNGNYVVSVTDNKGRAALCAAWVVDPEPVACVPSESSALHGKEIDFFATGGHEVYMWSAMAGAPDSGGPLDVQTPFVTAFAEAGLHRVTVTSAGMSATCTIAITHPCSAWEADRFHASAIAWPAGANVAFEDTTPGNVASRIWAFGDGQVSHDNAPLHRYATPGRYVARLTVTETITGCVSLVDLVVEVPRPYEMNFLQSNTCRSMNDPVSSALALQQSLTSAGEAILDGASLAGARLQHQWSSTRNSAVPLVGETPGPRPDSGAADFAFLPCAKAEGFGEASSWFGRFIDANKPPYADAGEEQDVLGSSLVHLQGYSSYDPEGMPLTFSWQWQAGDQVTLTGNETVAPSFIAPRELVAGYADIELTVSDGNLEARDTVRIWLREVQPAAPAPPGQVLQNQGSSPQMESRKAPSPGPSLLVMVAMCVLIAVVMVIRRRPA